MVNKKWLSRILYLVFFAYPKTQESPVCFVQNY
jgi:hypothetical protein